MNSKEIRTYKKIDIQEHNCLNDDCYPKDFLFSRI